MSEQENNNSEKEEWRAFKGVVGKAFGSVKSLLAGNSETAEALPQKAVKEEFKTSAPRTVQTPQKNSTPKQTAELPTKVELESELKNSAVEQTKEPGPSAQDLRLEELEKMLAKFERRQARRQRRIEKRIEEKADAKSLSDIKEELLKASFLTREIEEAEDDPVEQEETVLPQALGDRKSVV